MEQKGFSSLSDLQTAFTDRFDRSKEELENFLLCEAGLSKKSQAAAVARFVERTIVSQESRPINNVDIKPLTLCVEGNIGAGKSTFLSSIIKGSTLLEDLGTSIVLEPVEKWQQVRNRGEQVSAFEAHNILNEFYKNPTRFAYTFQHHVFMTRLLLEAETRSGSVRIMERSILSDRMIFVESVYEKGWLSDLEFSLFNSWYEPVIKVSPHLIPDAFIYLRTTPEVCLKRLKRRARGEETEIDLQYLRTLHNKHEYWLNQDKHGDVPDEPAGFTDSTLHSICFLRDGCLSTLRGIPVLVLDFDENLNVNRSSHAKRAMRRAVASFVSFVQKRALGDYDRAQMTHEYCPSFLEVKHWNDFYDDAMSAEDKTSSQD